MKYFALGLAATAGAVDLERFGNQTYWAGNSDSPSGAQMVFDLQALSNHFAFVNGTGSCTVTFDENLTVNGVTATSLNPLVHAGGNSFVFVNANAHSTPDTMEVMFTGDLDGDAPDDSSASVSCDDSYSMAASDLVMTSFPHHGENSAVRTGIVNKKDGQAWGTFTMNFPGATNVTMITAPATAEKQTDQDWTVDATLVTSDDVHFSYETADLSGSYQITVMNSN